jgi:hypothetical protein
LGAGLLSRTFGGSKFPEFEDFTKLKDKERRIFTGMEMILKLFS